MIRIVVHRRAVQYMGRLSRDRREKIKERLNTLREEPLNTPGVRPVFGEWTGYRRLRIGNLRVIFWYDEQNETIFVDHIGPRGDIYKR